MSTMFDVPFDAAKRKIVGGTYNTIHGRNFVTFAQASGTAIPSFVSKLVSTRSQQEDEKDYEDLIKSVAGTTFIGTWTYITLFPRAHFLPIRRAGYSAFLVSANYSRWKS